jgi:hypothetical protein
MNAVDESWSIWKEQLVDYFKVLYKHITEGAEENHETPNLT